MLESRLRKNSYEVVFTDIVLCLISHIQFKIQGKIGYMFRLEKAIIRPITRTLLLLPLFKNKMGGSFGTSGERRSAYRILVG
jgi:hypothetical protein